MKKLTLFLLLPLALLVGAIYLLIPTNITVTKIIAVNCTATASARFFMDTKQWHAWWPIDSANKSSITSQHFYYKNAEHQPIHPLFNGHQIATTINEQSITGEIIYAQVGVDSVAFFWKYLFTTSTNPIQRVKDYLILRALKNNISEISRKLKSFLENPDKVYGIHIQHQIVQDTILVSTRNILNSYPNNATIYAMINQLQDYSQKKGAIQTGHPMLNITKLDTSHFQTMVALPINKKIEETPQFSWKRMVAGNILVSEIKGGESRVKEALHQMQLYVTDYHLTAPAIPFVSLVTNRLHETDSSKWVTRIYYPIM